MAAARITIYIAPSRGRPGRPLEAGDHVEDGARFGWRMLAANNREVARSATIFDDIDGCMEAVVRLRRNVGSGVVVASRTGRADWAWRFRIAGTDVAGSSRTYQRRLQCEAACSLFVELVPEAEVIDVRTLPVGGGSSSSGSPSSGSPSSGLSSSGLSSSGPETHVPTSLVPRQLM